MFCLRSSSSCGAGQKGSRGICVGGWQMGEEQERRWSRLNVIFGIARFFVALVALVLMFVIAYTGNAGFRASVDSVVAPIGSAAAKLLGGFVAAVSSALTSFLFGVLGRRAQQSNWRGRWRKWRRERYVRALVWLSRPVEEDVLLRLTAKTDSPPDGRLESRMKRLLASLDDDQLQVYETFLEQYLATLFQEETRVRAADVGFRPVTSASHMDKRLHGACEELEAVGLLPDLTWGDTADGLHVDATVHSEMHGLEVRVILYMVRDELRSRGIAPRRS